MAMIGDRTMTDIVFGNRHGMLTIKTDPFSPHLDNFVVRTVRSWRPFMVVDSFEFIASCSPDAHIRGLVCGANQSAGIEGSVKGRVTNRHKYHERKEFKRVTRCSCYIATINTRRAATS